MPCLYGITLAVSDMARSVRPWNAWSNVTTAGLPVALRAIFTAFSTASAPEFANIVRLSNSPGANAFSRSASSMYGSFAVTWKHVCVSSSSCFCAAATTSGGVWPTFRTEMPVAKSISRLPSTSSMIEPEARAVTVGWTLTAAWGTAAFRRSNHSRDFGPGISVRTFRSCGMSIGASFRSRLSVKCATPGRSAARPGPSPESSSGRGRDLDDAAILFGEVPEVDARWFHAERREDRADLAPMIGPVVQRLREPDPHRGVGLGPVVAAPHGDGVRIDVLCQEPRPGGAVSLHRGTELRQGHVVLVDQRGAPPSDGEEVRGVGPHEVANRLEDRAVGPLDGGRQLLGAEREARIDQPQRGPDVVGERVLQ